MEKSNDKKNKPLIKKLIIKTELKLLTGLHIGASSESVEIGGIDNPVVKIATKNNEPYIPGSSLKGKIRSLLEQVRGSDLGGADDVNQLFGYSESKIPTRLIVRDAYIKKNDKGDIDSEQYKKAVDLGKLDMPYTEAKWENVIDRIKGTAEHPRQMERVPAGATFSVQFVINVFEDKEAEKDLALLKEGIEILENDYLGGSGTRGYGWVKFGELPEKLDDFKEEGNFIVINFSNNNN